MRGTIWFDVTTLREWHGRPAVGIVRTEREICRHFLAEYADCTRFCVYVSAGSRLVELEAGEVVRLLEPPPPQVAAPAKEPANSPANAPVASRPPAEERVKMLALRFLSWLPERWRHPMKQRLLALRPRVHQALNLARQLRDLLRGTPVQVPSVPPPAPPGDKVAELGPHDVYVSMGLDWTYKDVVRLFGEKRRRGFRMILFCYDLIPYKLPQLFANDVVRNFAQYFVDMAWCADHVFCISAHSQRDFAAFLLEAHHGRAPATSVIPLGCEISPPDYGHVADAVRALLERPFILFVSTIERRKNHETIYRAYTRLIDAGMKPPVAVFVGMRGWGVDELFKDLSLDQRVAETIVVLQHVNDDELSALYEKALFTVYPSLYEGWGLPVAESLAHGKFCLASNTSSLPEAGGDLVRYLDPWDVPAWTQALRELFEQPEEVARLNRRARELYLPPRWKDAARMVFETAQTLGSIE
ncbi:MAG: glycosyltransferase family 1 protein [Sterolibacterium sp.]|nr:glycosyltransferase family 1 protein [Sterolibacterium sp.]